MLELILCGICTVVVCGIMYTFMSMLFGKNHPHL